MPLDLSSLHKALAALKELAEKAENDAVMGQLDETLRKGIRAGVILYFEFTYELCWKLLKCWLEANQAKGMMLGITHKELFRLGAEHGLIDDPERWWFFHECRNRTSHTYNLEIAEEVYDAAIEFIPYAETLYAGLEQRNS
ncbi:MAG: nucleotidyltransferase [Ectothiorhodospiraceae bacterium]|nr:nucleotidyltransferase [Ectothiorhodospiraceae bacterium]